MISGCLSNGPYEQSIVFRKNDEPFSRRQFIFSRVTPRISRGDGRDGGRHNVISSQDHVFKTVPHNAEPERGNLSDILVQAENQQGALFRIVAEHRLVTAAQTTAMNSRNLVIL